MELKVYSLLCSQGSLMADLAHHAGDQMQIDCKQTIILNSVLSLRPKILYYKT